MGNSNVISMPREFESQGFAVGESVLLIAVGDGEVRMISAERMSKYLEDADIRASNKYRPVLDLLEAYDRGEVERTVS